MPGTVLVVGLGNGPCQAEPDAGHLHTASADQGPPPHPSPNPHTHSAGSAQRAPPHPRAPVPDLLFFLRPASLAAFLPRGLPRGLGFLGPPSSSSASSSSSSSSSCSCFLLREAALGLAAGRFVGTAHNGGASGASAPCVHSVDTLRRRDAWMLHQAMISSMWQGSRGPLAPGARAACCRGGNRRLRREPPTSHPPGLLP